MKLAIMQPYFFPYLGYYSLIAKTDQFVLLDTAQFMRHGWIERNRVLKPSEGWQYIAVPLEKHQLGTAIRDVRIRHAEDWKSRIYRQLEHYRKRSPFYKEALEVIKEAIEVDVDTIVDLNANVLNVTCQYIGLKADIKTWSFMDLPIAEVAHAGQWALNISHSLGAKEYINPVGGMSIFDPVEFDAKNIKLTFLGNNCTPYSQRRSSFEAGLSIIDAMMFNQPSQILDLVQDVYVAHLEQAQGTGDVGGI